MGGINERNLAGKIASLSYLLVLFVLLFEQTAEKHEFPEEVDSVRRLSCPFISHSVAQLLSS